MRGGCGDEGFFNDPGLAFANCGRPNFYCENFRRPADSTRRVFSMIGGLGSAPRDERGRQLRRPPISRGSLERPPQVTGPLEAVYDKLTSCDDGAADGTEGVAKPVAAVD